jgi:hypothetical protein
MLPRNDKLSGESPTVLGLVKELMEEAGTQKPDRTIQEKLVEKSNILLDNMKSETPKEKLQPQKRLVFR